MSTSVIIGLITVVLLLLLRKFVLPPGIETVAYSKEEMEKLTEDFEELVAVQGFAFMLMMVGIVFFYQMTLSVRWSEGEELMLAGGAFLLLGVGSFGAIAFYFWRRGRKWADVFTYWISKKYRFGGVSVLRVLAMVTTILGTLILLYGLFFSITGK